MTAYVIDIETNNLLSKMLDYTSIPYKLNKEARLWCIVVRNVDTNEVKHSSLTECTKQWLQEVLHDCTILITQNGVKFDQVALKLFGLLDYTIGYPADNERPATPSTLFGKPVEIVDVLLYSRLFFPDRFGGHSLKAWGERLGQYKGDYHDFDNYSQEMLDYCIQDTLVTALVYKKLLEDWNSHDWSKAYAMELKLADLAIRRETFGFKFDKELALSNLAELEVIMKDLTDKVNPLLPPKPLNKGQQDYYTPPKIQFKKNGDVSSHMTNFAEKIGAEIKERVLHYNGKEIELPCTAPVADSVVATIDDMDWVKQHLLNLGWTPTEWKERDLTKDSKKQPISAEKRVEALDRWWAETIGGKYTKQRFYELDMPPTLKTYDKLKEKLNDKWPVRVPTSPCVRVGVEKNICPNLIKMGSKVDFAQDFAHYLTYKHRRNSIAGGIDEDFDFDEEAPPTGYLSMLREDGRVSTPAIEIGASTNRYKHISICNIPRATSLFGEKMRAMFCCGDGGYQLGFDFASLENVIQGHHILPYDGEELAKQLVAEKPNDLHCYSEDTQILTNNGWVFFNEVTLDSLVAQYDYKGNISFVNPTDVVWSKYRGVMLESKSGLKVTPNHRVMYKSYSEGMNENRVVLAKDFVHSTDKRYVTGGSIEGNVGFNLDPYFIKLLVATQADGHLAKDCSAIAFCFTKERKIERLLDILNHLSIKYTETKHYRKGRLETTLRLNASKETVAIRGWLTENKSFTDAFVNMSLSEMTHLVSEVGYWDGTLRENGDVVLDTTDEQTAKVLQTCAALIGRKTSLTRYLKKASFGDCNIVRVYLSRESTKPVINTDALEKTNYEGYIGCVTVPSGLVLVKRNDKIVVSGNSVNAKKLGISRGDAKSITYALLYGAAASKLKKMLGITDAQAKLLYEQFWDAVLPLKLLKERLTASWQANGKKFIVGIDNRKLFVRSQHSILNMLFQGNGVLCAKWVTVLMFRNLEELGLRCDPFESEVDVISMIEYHDEQQLYVRKNLVKFNVYEDEDAAKADKLNYKQSSAVAHSKKYYFCENNLVTTEIYKAISTMRELLGLRTNLGIEWSVGRNWLETH